MPKTNYTKAEEALTEGLQRMTISQYMAAAPSKKEKSAAAEREKSQERSKLLKILQIELNYLQKTGHPVYERFQIKKSELDKFLENPSAISAEEWQRVVKVKAELVEFKKGIENRSSEEANESQVKNETQKNAKKRFSFNVNEKWLPLK